jgi:membrane-associated protein
LFDLEALITAFGYALLFGIVFVESGLLVGFFLPGDTLLFTAGMLASQGHLDLLSIFGVCIIGAILGDSVGYYLGKKFGKKVFEREGDYFNSENLEKAKEFYSKYGGLTIVIARFVPVIRTIAPVMAGTSEMHYEKFLFYNIVGGFLWVVSVTLLGYSLGHLVSPEFFALIIVGAIGVSILPAFLKNFAKKKKRVLQ